jgi:hypothetical protein
MQTFSYLISKFIAIQDAPSTGSMTSEWAELEPKNVLN